MDGQAQGGGFLRVELRGEWRSICKVCHQSVAKAQFEEGLQDGEARHECPGHSPTYTPFEPSGGPAK